MCEENHMDASDSRSASAHEVHVGVLTSCLQENIQEEVQFLCLFGHEQVSPVVVIAEGFGILLGHAIILKKVAFVSMAGKFSVTRTYFL